MVDETLLIVAAVAGLAVIAFILKGVFEVRSSEVGILVRKFSGLTMPEGQIIARHGQIGIQAHTLMPGLYFRNPIIWNVRKVTITEIASDEVGLIESVDGRPLPKGRLLGDEVECDQFQDAEKFLDNGGFKGPQIGILRPGRYRINTLAFAVTKIKATLILPEKIGLITAQDGQPLPSRLIVAPEPLTAPDGAHPSARSHNYFQDGQAFVESEGYRGPQLATLQPGQYYINTLLFNVKVNDVYEIPPGFVAVIRSNVGEELERSQVPAVAPGATTMDEDIHEAETLLVTDKSTRGIWKDPIAPGKYNLNTVAYTAYPVPTSAIMVDWADTERPSAPTMSRAPAAPTKDTSDYPYLTPQTVQGVSYFQFNQLKVTSKDGFQLEVDVRMVIRINPENAAFVIARFGSVFNLIQQIVHPLIDASFRNNAGEKKALEFVQSRTQLQQEALEKARTEFEKYHVEAQNLLISYIDVDENLLATQTQKEIAMQQQAQYQQQALAEEQRIAVQEKTARANLQPVVVQAALQVEINANNAKAAVKQAEGYRDSTIIKADGDAAAVRRVGEAQADAYHAQADVIGSDRVALLGAFDRLKDVQPEVITPRTLVMSDGGAGGASNTILTTYLATLLSGEGARPLAPYQRPHEQPYVSNLVGDGTDGGDEGGGDGSSSPSSSPSVTTGSVTMAGSATAPATPLPGAKPGQSSKQ
ncbi:MAG: SPFH domain-containing protein [Nitrososphaerales archaeon]